MRSSIAGRVCAMAVSYRRSAMLLKNYALAAAACALCLVSLTQSAFSHGGIAQDPWNPAHLTNLPLEIRVRAKRWEAACGAPIAVAQQFALYLTTAGTEFVALHFDDFQCLNRGVVCDASGCLHEVYVKFRGRYRKVFSLRAQDIRLVREQDAAFLDTGPLERSTTAPSLERLAVCDPSRR